MKRRKFFQNTSISAAGLLLANGVTKAIAGNTEDTSTNSLMEEVLKYRKIDAHKHVGFGNTLEAQLDFADRLGIEKLVVSDPLLVGKVTPEEFREANNLVLDAMNRYPDRYMGWVFVNPIYQKESLEEIKRCIDLGMIGLKVYNQVKINDPLFYPIIEKFIDLKMIILMHSFAGLGHGGYRTKYGNLSPNESTPDDFVEAAIRYPEAMFQYAHLGGGGDWEYACKAIQDYPNIYVDTAGSNNEGNMVDFALKYLGEDRVFYSSDLDTSFYQGVAGVLSAKLNDDQRKKIFFENFNNVLRKSENHVD